MQREHELNDRVTFRINHKQWVEFKEECQKYNLPASIVIRQFIQDFNDTITIKDLFEEQKSG